MSEAIHIEFAAKTEQIAAEHKRMTKSGERERWKWAGLGGNIDMIGFLLCDYCDKWTKSDHYTAGDFCLSCNSIKNYGHNS